MQKFDVIVIGGGQSGLAVGYYLRRTGLSYIILDNQQEGGGEYYPTRDEAISSEGASSLKIRQ